MPRPTKRFRECKVFTLSRVLGGHLVPKLHRHYTSVCINIPQVPNAIFLQIPHPHQNWAHWYLVTPLSTVIAYLCHSSVFRALTKDVKTQVQFLPLPQIIQIHLCHVLGEFSNPQAIET